MANDFERRLSKVERTLEDHLPNLYAFTDKLQVYIDELRADHEDSKRRIDQNEKQIAELKNMQSNMLDVQARVQDTMEKISKSHDMLREMQGTTMTVLRAIGASVKDHEGRLAAGKL